MEREGEREKERERKIEKETRYQYQKTTPTQTAEKTLFPPHQAKEPVVVSGLDSLVGKAVWIIPLGTSVI